MLRVHAIGIGAVGTLLAHQIKMHVPRVDLTLILRSEAKLEAFQQAESSLSVADATPAAGRPAGEAQRQAPVRLAAEAANDKLCPEKPITILLSTLKAPACLPALRQVAPRLTHSSTVVLLHNGLGVREELVRELWPDEARRPTLVQGITSAGVRIVKPFSVQLEGRGAWTFAVVPTLASLNDSAVPPASLESMTGLLAALGEATNSFVTPRLVPFAELEEAALLKLAVNVIINPLTALFRLPNGALAGKDFESLLNLLIGETSIVLRSLIDAAGRPLLAPAAFSTEALQAAVLDVARKTASNRSSMLQDVEAGRPTEVDYISGHLVGLAAEAGKQAPLNALLREKVASLGAGAAPLTVAGLLRECELSLRCA